MSKSTKTRPERRGAKLDVKKARAIAERIAAGERHASIVKRYRVTTQTVDAIKSGKRWSRAIDDDLRARMKGVEKPRLLDATQAREVMLALDAGRTGRSVAKEFGISPSMVSAIKNGSLWPEVDPELRARLARKPRRGKALDESQAALIKRRLLDGESTRKVAAEFGVSASTVLAIAQGKTWAGIEPAKPA